MIVAFDGLNGVGKTTMAKRFAKEFDYKYIERPIYKIFGINNNKPKGKYKIVQELENKIYNENDNVVIKACLTGLGILYVQKNSKNSRIVIDRHILSNFSYNGTKESLPLFEAFIKMGIYPDVSILLYADKEELVKRIKKRNPNDLDLVDIDIMFKSYENIIKFLKTYKLPSIIINTNNKTEEEVFEEIKNKYMEVFKENGNIEPSR